MSEFLRSNPESFENEQESNPDIAELAVSGLSRVTSEQEDDTDAWCCRYGWRGS